MPPLSFFLKPMLGGCLFSRMPKPSSSCSISFLCPSGFNTSSTIKIRLQVRATGTKEEVGKDESEHEWIGQISNNVVPLLLITCNNLSASALAIFSSLDNSWKIQKLTRNNQWKWSDHILIFVGAEYKNHPRLPEFWHLCSERLQARLSEWWTHRRRPRNTHLPGYWAAWTSPLKGNPQSRYVRHQFSQHRNLRRRKIGNNYTWCFNDTNDHPLSPNGGPHLLLQHHRHLLLVWSAPSAAWPDVLWADPSGEPWPCSSASWPSKGDQGEGLRVILHEMLTTHQNNSIVLIKA